MKIFFCIAALLLSFFSCTHQSQQGGLQSECYFVPPDEALDSIRNSKKLYREYLESFFSSLHQNGTFNGSVLIAKQGEITYMGSYGKRSLNSSKELNVATSFQLASVSKIFTAVAILQLFEQGKINLDELVKYYIPEFPYDKITVRMLLSHRSGLPRYDAFNKKQWDWSKPMTNEDMIKLFAQYNPGLFFKPNQKHDYSNTNFAFLASVIERISGKKFADYCRDNIFFPADMQHSFVFDIFNPPHKDSIALGHARGYRYALEPQQDYLNGVVGDKGIYASVVDLYKFDEALYQGKLLKKENLELAFQPYIKNKYSQFEEYGLGHRLKDFRMNGEFIPYHSGWWRGFKTLLIRDVKNHHTIILLSNHENAPNAQLTWSLLNI